MRSTTFALMLAAALAVACTRIKDIPTEFPTPEPSPAATPLAPLELKRDAELEAEFARIAEDAKGKVGVAAVVLETGDAALLNADGRYPMQSVYKLPIAMAVMEQIRLGKLDLDEVLGVTPSDFVRKGMASALRDKNPTGGEFTIRELIRLSIVESDGTASDVLMRVAGGASEIQIFLTNIGISDIKVLNAEKEIGRDWETQYQNWASPIASVNLLHWLDASAESTSGKSLPIAMNEGTKGVLLLRFMADSIPGAMRLKRQLPRGTVVAHKTGTGGVRDGIAAALNDIGLIYSNGRTLAIAVYVSDSRADESTREAVIAKIAKAAYDRWSKAAEKSNATVQPANFNTRHTLN